MTITPGKRYRAEDNGLASEVFKVVSLQGTNYYVRLEGANLIEPISIYNPIWANVQEVNDHSGKEGAASGTAPASEGGTPEPQSGCPHDK